MTDRQPQSGVFRDSTAGAEARREHLLAARLAESQAIPPAARRIYVRRWTRTLAGVVMTLGGVAVLAVGSSRAVRAAADAVLPGRAHTASTVLIGATWLAAALAYLVGYRMATRRYYDRTAGQLLNTPDVYDDIERLSHLDVRTTVRAMVRRLEARSMALPIVGMAALLPATMLLLLVYLYDEYNPLQASFDLILGQLAPSLILPLCLVALITLLAAIRLVTRSTETLRQQSRFARALVALGVIVLPCTAFIDVQSLVGLFACVHLVCLDVVWYLFVWYVVRERLALQPWLVV